MPESIKDDTLLHQQKNPRDRKISQKNHKSVCQIIPLLIHKFLQIDR